MALYSLENEQFLGMSHSGPMSVNGESAVELSDEEVDILVSLIHEKNTTDVEKLGLEQQYPAIYEKLDEAYYEMAYNAEEIYWLWEGYHNGYFEYDTYDLKEYCKAHCGFNYHFDKIVTGYDEDEEVDEGYIEDCENDAFDEWLREYVKGLSDDEARDFFYNHMNADLNLDDISYDVQIPDGVIKKARG